MALAQTYVVAFDTSQTQQTDSSQTQGYPYAACSVDRWELVIDNDNDDDHHVAWPNRVGAHHWRRLDCNRAHHRLSDAKSRRHYHDHSLGGMA